MSPKNVELWQWYVYCVFLERWEIVELTINIGKWKDESVEDDDIKNICGKKCPRKKMPLNV